MTELKDVGIAEFKAHFGGDVLLPDSAGYDEVRQIWNAMIDRRPALIARARSPEDVVRAVKFARKHDADRLRARRRAQHRRQCGVRRRPHDRPVADEARQGRSGRAPGRGRARLHARRLRCGRAGPRPRHAARHQFHDRRGRADARRGLWLVEPQVRHDRRQPARRGDGDGRWQSVARQRQRERRPVLGRARWRRQLRHRHELRVPAPSGRAAGAVRADRLPVRRGQGPCSRSSPASPRRCRTN